MLFPVIRGLAILLWLVILVNFVAPFPAQLALTLNITAIALLVAHFGEFVMFNKFITRLPDSKMVAFIKTMLFGLFYWKDPALKPVNQ